ncbi:MAG: FAD-dependent oxidoreductase [Candidatus Sumerlaeia bacterium]|nr:FAD-dependent oxidoreductase [Candidatus Sumerlaeia bacterium]
MTGAAREFSDLLRVRSHWHRAAPPEAFPAAEPLPARARFAIAGLGLMGASVAYALAERGVPARDIAVLDGAPAAFGASGRNAGFVLSFPGTELLEWRASLGLEGALELVRRTRRNREWVRGFATREGIPAQHGGSYNAAASPAEHDAMREALDLVKQAGFDDGRWLDRFPFPGGFHGAFHEPGDFGIHPVLYVARLAQRSGARIAQGAYVQPEGFSATSEGVRIDTSAGQLEAEHLVVCTESFTPRFFQRLGLLARIQPARNQVLLARPEGESDNRLFGDAIFYARDGWDYWRQLPDGRVVLGGGRDKAPADESTHELAPCAAPLAYLEGELLPRLLDGRAFEVEHRWQGIMGMTPDRLSVLGALPDTFGRVHFSLGLSDYGLGLHREVAVAVAAHLLDGADAGVFSPRRLGA